MKFLTSSMTDIYQQNILDHYKHPENFGKLEGADVVQVEFNPLCGDKLILYLVINDKEIVDVKFEGQGCAISVAAMSMLSEELKGMSLEKAVKLDKDYITDLLGVELGPTRLKCALLSWQALQNAIRSL